jgi:hypothetical protein
MKRGHSSATEHNRVGIADHLRNSDIRLISSTISVYLSESRSQGRSSISSSHAAMVDNADDEDDDDGCGDEVRLWF